MVPRSLVLTASDFSKLDGRSSATQVQQHFSEWISDLYDILNTSPTLSQVQRIRGKRTSAPTFEGSARYSSEHWYTYHRGGRSEAQFNVGMFSGHLRLGVGFEPTGGGYGDVDAVLTAQRKFADALRSQRGGAEVFCATNHLEVEVNSADGRGVAIKDVNYFLDVVDGRRPRERWIFLGRLLRADRDRAILQDASLLVGEIERVFLALWPVWLVTRSVTR